MKRKKVYDSKKFLEFDSPGATLGMTRKEPEPKYGITAECPRCHGYGGWHLDLDAYGPGKHFNCSCSNCNGWGYVKPGDADHVHEFTGMDEAGANEFRAAKGLGPVRYTRGNCCHNMICKVCGSYRFVDSSD